MAGKKNQDQRQIDFLRYYLDPKGETFSNALQSALRAGYTQKYAENITTLNVEWLGEAMGRRERMLNKAEKRLESSIDSKNERIALDSSTFIAETLGKKVGYSKRVEQTGADGKDLPTPILVNAIKVDVPSNERNEQNSELKEAN